MLSQPLADHAAAQTAGPALGQTEGLSLGHYGLSVPTMPASMPFARNAKIYGENEPAKYFYKVVSGAVRTYRVLSDGRRQIAGFSPSRRHLRRGVRRDAFVFRPKRLPPAGRW